MTFGLSGPTFFQTSVSVIQTLHGWLLIEKKKKTDSGDGGIGRGVPYFEGEDDFTVVKRHP